jgi:hypothetical protein
VTPTTPRSSVRGPVDRVSFDEQAGSFETRIGMPAGVPEQIAAAVREYAGLEADDLLVELGAGTGLIGQWLTRLPIRYLGLELSRPMLEVFRPRLPPGDRAQLRHADANQRWPVADGNVRAVFGSRAFQLLDIEHLVHEANRVGCTDRAVLVHGRPVLSQDSPKLVARRRLQALLRARGFAPRPAERLLWRVFQYAVEQGGTALAPRTVTTWQRTLRPPEVLDHWRHKWSMGGITPPPEVAAEVLAELDAWAAETYGDPPEPVTTEESYVLEGVQLRPTKE